MTIIKNKEQKQIKAYKQDKKNIVVDRSPIELDILERHTHKSICYRYRPLESRDPRIAIIIKRSTIELKGAY